MATPTPPLTRSGFRLRGATLEQLATATGRNRVPAEWQRPSAEWAHAHSGVQRWKDRFVARPTYAATAARDAQLGYPARSGGNALHRPQQLRREP